MKAQQRAASKMLLALVGAVVLLVSGCVSGRIYTNVTEPLTTNFSETPVMGDKGKGDVIKIEYNSMQVQFNDNSIGHIAKKAGLEEIHYADKQTISILGIWTSTYVHVYGTRNLAAQ